MSVVLTERDLSDPLNREQMRWEYERAQGDISLAAWDRKWGAAIVEQVNDDEAVNDLVGAEQEIRELKTTIDNKIDAIRAATDEIENRLIELEKLT